MVAVTSLTDAARLASALPPLLMAAHRVASTVMQGVHGRRRVGQGDAFWQFRQYRPGDAINRIVAVFGRPRDDVPRHGEHYAS